jgi:opacity protein-like surface antigen
MKNLRKIITLLSFLLALNLGQFAKAGNVVENTVENSDIFDGFMLKSAITLEYQGMDIDGSTPNNHFENRHFEQQLKNFDNIVIGLNFRVHKYLGFNLNWAQNTLKNDSLKGFTIANNASLNIENINATSLLYFPIIGDNWLEGFAEIGVADVNSRVKFLETSGAINSKKSHETALLYGGGIQFAPYDFDIAFRLSFQRYEANLGLVDSKINTFRGGVIIPF